MDAQFVSNKFNIVRTLKVISKNHFFSVNFNICKVTLHANTCYLTKTVLVESC